VTGYELPASSRWIGAIITQLERPDVVGGAGRLAACAAPLDLGEFGSNVGSERGWVRVAGTERQASTGISEAELVKKVLEICDDLHLGVFHVGSYRIPAATRKPGSSAGFPDLVIVGPGGFLFRECKAELGRPSREQQAWGRRIAAAPGGNYDIWRPEDLASGRILRELRELD
jgi:hypothetical protein